MFITTDAVTPLLTFIRLLYYCAVLGFLLAVGSLAHAAGPLAHTADMTTDIVLVVDNSGSTRQSDPNRLRGVAAQLILDALVLPSANVRVGVVFFNSQVSGDDVLGSEADARKKLSSQLEESGNTDMEGGMTQALKLLESSTATQKIIVVLTDGAPDPRGDGNDHGQIDILRNDLAPLAANWGVKIFALGFSDAVNRTFLEEITGPTGGRMVTVNNAQEMLKVAKQLVSGFNNVHRLKDESLPGGSKELPFDLPAGVERLRVTVVLEQPRRFRPGQIDFSLQGCPAPDSEELYTTTIDGTETVVAWTGFLSNSGQNQRCTLQIQANKPGAQGHGGAQVLIEGRTDLNSELACRPDQERLTYGTEMVCEITVTNNAGPIDPNLLQHSGRLQTQGSGGPGSVAVTVAGSEVRFKVPEVSGRQTVRIESSIDPGIPAVVGEYSYQAIPPQPAQLRSNPDRIDLGLIGPDRPETVSAIEVWTEFPAGDPRALQFTPQLLSTLKDVMTLAIDGRPIKAGGTQSLPLPRGKRLTLELRVSLKNRTHGQLVNIEDGRYTGTLIIKSADAEAPLEIPFQIEIRKPKLLLATPQNFSLYWNPNRPQNLKLADVSTDGVVDGRFTVEPAEQQVVDQQGVTLGKLALLPAEKSSQGQYPLTRAPYPLRAIYTPAAGAVPIVHGPHEVTFRIKSPFGAEEPLVLRLWTLPVWWEGWSWLGPVSLHLQPLLLWVLVGGSLVWVVRAAGRRGLALVRWRHFRPGQPLDANDGDLGAGQEHTGLALANDPDHRLADTVLGRLRFQRSRLTLTASYPEGGLAVNDRPIAGQAEIRPGDVLTLHADGADDPLWELEYLGPDERGGAFQVIRNPLGLSVGQTLKGLLVGLLVILVLRQALLSDWLAEFASRLWPVEALYLLGSSWWY